MSPAFQIEQSAYDCANHDPVLALLLVLRMIWRGQLRADKRGLHRAAS